MQHSIQHGRISLINNRKTENIKTLSAILTRFWNRLKLE